jgi:hypothetical protein
VATSGSTAVPFLDSLGITLAPAQSEDVRVVQPVLRSPPVTNLASQADEVVSNGPPFVTAASTSSGPALARFSIGRGDIWVLTALDLLSNDQLNQADNAALVLNLIPAGGKVVMEEYTGSSAAAGGARQDWLGASVWGLAAIFVFFLLLAYRGLTGVRLGPAVRPLPDTHRPASEFVISMAGTLADARKRSDLLALYQGWLRRGLRERHIDASSTESARRLLDEATSLLDEPEGLNDAELLKQVQSIVLFSQRLERIRV